MSLKWIGIVNNCQTVRIGTRLLGGYHSMIAVYLAVTKIWWLAHHFLVSEPFDQNVVVTNALNYSAAALFHLFHHFYQLYHFKPRRRSNQLRARNSQRRTFRVVVGPAIEMSLGWGVGTGCPLSRWGEVRGGCHAHLIFRFQKDGFWWNLSGLIDLLLVSDKSG